MLVVNKHIWGERSYTNTSSQSDQQIMISTLKSLGMWLLWLCPYNLVHDPPSNTGTIFLRFSRNTEADASEYLENLEIIFYWYYMHSDVFFLGSNIISFIIWIVNGISIITWFTCGSEGFVLKWLENFKTCFHRLLRILNRIIEAWLLTLWIW